MDAHQVRKSQHLVASEDGLTGQTGLPTRMGAGSFCLIVLEDSRKTIFLERRREGRKKRREEGARKEEGRKIARISGRCRLILVAVLSC